MKEARKTGNNENRGQSRLFQRSGRLSFKKGVREHFRKQGSESTFSEVRQVEVGRL